MANVKGYMMARRATNYRFLTNDLTLMAASSELELDESDVWGGSTRSDSPDSRPPPPPSSRQSRRPLVVAAARCGAGGEFPKWLPVNIPDWSKILRDEYKLSSGRERIGNLDDYSSDFDDDCYGDGDERMPPHEYLARTRMASLSVHEGIGRTLKGRDLSKVRNAIWEKIGFQD